MDDCGREFSKRGLATHTRLAHPTNVTPTAESPVAIPEALPPDVVPPVDVVPPETDPAMEVQCIYCGIRFEDQHLDRHQAAMHKGLPLQRDPVMPPGSERLAPGAEVRTSEMSTMKVPWTQKWIELGFECTNHDHHDPARPGWRKIPEKGEIPNCGICGEPMRKMFQMIEWDAPDNAPPTATFQGVTYLIRAGAVNMLPDIIVSILREANEERKTAHLRKQDTDPAIGLRLTSIGYLPPLEEEDEEQMVAAPDAASRG